MQYKSKNAWKKWPALSSSDETASQAAQNFFPLFHERKEKNTTQHIGLFQVFPDFLQDNKLYTNTIFANHEDEGQIFKIMHGFLLQGCVELPSKQGSSGDIDHQKTYFTPYLLNYWSHTKFILCSQLVFIVTISAYSMTFCPQMSQLPAICRSFSTGRILFQEERMQIVIYVAGPK